MTDTPPDGQEGLTPDPNPVLVERDNVLREKIGGSLDPHLAQKAEAAIQVLKTNFNTWIEETLAAMISARAELGEGPISRAAGQKLYKTALEVKSLGTTYGFPLLTRIAKSLCKLLGNLPDGTAAPAELINAHVDALRAILRDRIKDEKHPIGQMLANELESRVNIMVGK